MEKSSSLIINVIVLIIAIIMFPVLVTRGSSLTFTTTVTTETWLPVYPNGNEPFLVNMSSQNWTSLHDELTGIIPEESYLSMYATCLWVSEEVNSTIITRSALIFDVYDEIGSGVIVGAHVSLVKTVMSEPLPRSSASIMLQHDYAYTGAPHEPLEEGDYYYNLYDTDVDGESGETKDLVDGERFNITVNSHGLDYLNNLFFDGGTAEWIVRCSPDVNDAEPAVINFTAPPGVRGYFAGTDAVFLSEGIDTATLWILFADNVTEEEVPIANADMIRTMIQLIPFIMIAGILLWWVKENIYG